MVSREHTDQGRERKRQLLEAAAALFAGRGYAQTRISDICAAAGVAKGLFYWYFPTKESLFVELVRAMRLELRRCQADAMEPAADPATRIRQGSAASVRFMADHAGYFGLLDAEREGPAIAAVLREGSDVYLRDVIVLVREAQEQGLVPDEDARALAVGVIGAVSSFGYAWRTGRIDIAPDVLAETVGRWVERALTSGSSPLSGAGASAAAGTARAAGRPQATARAAASASSG